MNEKSQLFFIYSSKLQSEKELRENGVPSGVSHANFSKARRIGFLCTKKHEMHVAYVHCMFRDTLSHKFKMHHRSNRIREALSYSLKFLHTECRVK